MDTGAEVVQSGASGQGEWRGQGQCLTSFSQWTLAPNGADQNLEDHQVAELGRQKKHIHPKLGERTESGGVEPGPCVHKAKPQPEGALRESRHYAVVALTENRE